MICRLATISVITALAAICPAAQVPCPYQTAHSAPLQPVEKVVASTETYTLYRVEFAGVRPGSRIPANVYVPRNPAFAAPYPAVVLQYGSGGNKNTNYIVMIGQIAVARGLLVITIDAPNRGERRGLDPRLNMMDPNLIQYLGDLSRATDYLCSRKDVDVSQIGYVGISWGAIAGITYCAHDNRIAAVAALVAGGNFANVIPGAVPEEIRKKTESYDPYYHIGLIAPRPLLLMNCTRDQLIPPFMSKSLHDAAPQGAKKIWLEADHYFDGVDRRRTCGEVIDFILSALPRKS